MRRTLSTALLLGIALPAFSVSALALPASLQQSDAATAPHVTPQSPDGAQPHGTVNSAQDAKNGTGSSNLPAKPATHKKKKKKKPATASAAHVTPQTPHVTPQTPEAAPPPPHTTPQ
jgi:hypothetical protein